MLGELGLFIFYITTLSAFCRKFRYHGRLVKMGNWDKGTGR